MAGDAMMQQLGKIFSPRRRDSEVSQDASPTPKSWVSYVERSFFFACFECSFLFRTALRSSASRTPSCLDGRIHTGAHHPSACNRTLSAVSFPFFVFFLQCGVEQSLFLSLSVSRPDLCLFELGTNSRKRGSKVRERQD